MAQAYNNFGATYADVVEMYPGSAAADYAGPLGTTLAGQTAINNALNRATFRVLSLLAPYAFRMLHDVELELVERVAASGQTAVTLGINQFAAYAGMWPVVAGYTHIWTGQPLTFQVKPRLKTDVMAGIGINYGTQYGFGVVQTEKDTSTYTVNASTGVVTFTTFSLQQADQVFASYRIDVENSAFQVPSVAAIVRLGAAAELGSRLYSAGDQTWDLVKKYQADWDAALADEKAGTWVPDEFRRIHHWKEVERATPNGIGSLRTYRGGGGGEIGSNGWTNSS